MRSPIKRIVLTTSALLFASATPALSATLQYQATLAPEAIGATGSGSALVTFDTILNTMRIEANFAGLSGTTTDAHIHCCTAAPGTGAIGVATMTPRFTGWPEGVTSGTYDNTFDTTLAATFNAPFVTSNGGTAAGALAALIAGIDANRAYFNIHTSMFPSGEIRGFLVPIPEPGTALLLGLGLGWIAAARRTRL